MIERNQRALASLSSAHLRGLLSVAEQGSFVTAAAAARISVSAAPATPSPAHSRFAWLN